MFSHIVRKIDRVGVKNSQKLVFSRLKRDTKND